MSLEEYHAVAVFKVINKVHIRASIREEDAMDEKGNHYVIRHAGEPTRYEVGALLTDVSPSELAAFPDRFQLTEGTMPSAVPAEGRLNPELLAMVRRAHSGDATNDEAALVGDVLEFVEKYMGSGTTENERAAMADKLKEFDMELYA